MWSAQHDMLLAAHREADSKLCRLAHGHFMRRQNSLRFNGIVFRQHALWFEEAAAFSEFGWTAAEAGTELVVEDGWIAKSVSFHNHADRIVRLAQLFG